MKRNTTFLMSLLVLLQAFLLSGCGRNATDDIVVTVSSTDDEDFAFYDYFMVEKTVEIPDSGQYLLSSVRDLFLADNFLYVLDDAKTLSKIDLTKGEIVEQELQVGRGPQDYLMPINITGDKERLYLLDYMAKYVHVYDLDLNHLDKFSVDSLDSPSSFLKVKDGFMFLNSFASDSIGQFVMTDDRGFKKTSFLKASEESGGDDDEFSDIGEIQFRVIYTDNYFYPESSGILNCYSPATNVMYRFDGKRLTRLYQLQYDKPQNSYGSIMKVFPINGNTLVCYLLNGVDRFAYYDKDLKLVADGKGMGERPFFQIWQQGSRLIRVIDSGESVRVEIFKQTN